MPKKKTTPPAPGESTHNMRQSRQWLRVTQSSTDDAIVTTDAHGRVSFLNPVIIDTLRQPFLVLDSSLRVITGNRSFYETFGVEKEQTEGHFIYELGNAQWNIPRLRELLEEILPQNHTFNDFEVEHEFEGIGPKVMLLNARRVRKSGDNSELILLAFEDITERRAADQNLRDSEVRYRRLFQTAKDGILILDANTGKIIDANAFMSGLVGLEPEQLLGKELYEIGMFKDIDENKQAFRELQQNRYIRYDHLPVQNQRGERVEVEFVANVYHEDHTLVAQCNVRDIAPRVAMEKKIIAQAEALAEESRRKDQFLAMLSHELRNPLAPIRSATHLLKLQEHGSENFIQKQAREVIERQVANLTRLVSDLLEVSRVVSGRIRLNPTIVDMNQVVRHAIETARPLIELRKHEMTLKLCSDPVWANADPTRMEEVFVNLLNNAAKYTPKGGRIELHCEHHQNHALVRVRDNGIGIEADMLRNGRIFELFTQADRSLDHAAGGLGIGLSLVHRIVQMHAGTVEAQSDGPGKGSEFIVRLPLVAAPGVEHSPPAEESSGERPDGMRVLVVDDNTDACTLLSHALRGKGYGVQVAHTGPDGLRVAQQWRPDVLLLDIGLPGLDGYEIARRLRAEKTTSEMRVIAMTGYGRDTDIKLAREAGFDAHLTKPFDFDEMVKLMAVKS